MNTHSVRGIVEYWHINTSLPCSIFEKLHIIRNRFVQDPLVVVRPLATQFVFDLETSVSL